MKFNPFHDLEYYLAMCKERQSHVDDLQQVYELVAAQLHMAKLNLIELNKRIAEMKK